MQYMEKKVCFQEKASLSNYYQAKGPPAALLLLKTRTKQTTALLLLECVNLFLTKCQKSKISYG